MRIIYAQHLDPSLRKGYETTFKRDLKYEIIEMTKTSIKCASQFYDDIHLYADKESYKYYKNLPVTLHELKTLPEFFCAAKLEVLKDQKDTDFLWVDPDIFMSTKFDIDETKSIMVDNMTYLDEKYYKRLGYFSNENPQYPMVREWLNSGLLWFKDKDVFDYHVNLYEELLTINKDARIVETWNISHCGEKYGYGVFRHRNNEYIHFDGYKKFYGITKKMIKNINSTL